MTEDLIGNVDIEAILGAEDRKMLVDVELFIREGLPAGEDHEVKSWLMKNMESQHEMTNLRSRVRHLLNVKRQEIAILRAGLIESGTTTKRYKSDQEGELLLRSDEYRRAASFLNDLMAVEDYVEQLSWILRNFAKKVNW